MKRLLKCALAELLMLLVCVPACAYETRQELREAYQALGKYEGASLYARQPSLSAPYAPGALEEAALDDALEYLNFLRALAGLEPVGRSELYDTRCQHGAALLAALDYADHNAPRPEDMDEDFYESAHLATTSSNLAKFNWMRPTILREGLAYFARDDGEGNLSVLGHRQWLLNPKMADTGFGLANSASGMSYVLMYAHDMGNEDAAWSEVCWPSAGAFPVELMHSNLAWSVTLNPERYDLSRSRISVLLREETRGLSFAFDCAAAQGDGFCSVSDAGYGAGPCVIFRPDFSGTDFTDYEQNQRWTVRIDGLRLASGEETSLEYTVEMTSLHPQEVANLEISPLEAHLAPGETAVLTAAVVPSYADDLSVSWQTTDAAVAVVDDFGTVTAVGPGACEIIASSANGRDDRCAVTVAE